MDLQTKLTSFAHKVYSELGGGFSERVYHNAMEVLLRSEGLPYETERIITIEFEGHTIGNLRADLIVDKKFIVELKATKSITPAMTNQAQKYLQLLNLPHALVINFPQPFAEGCEILAVEPYK